MQIILRNGECKHIKIHYYPDGQQNITLDMDYFNNVKEFIEIKCNVRNFDELEILLCLVAALKKNDFYISNIHFNYLFGMRSDRSFEIGMPNYFRDVIAPIINSLNIPQITFLQPHSLISLACINNAHVENLIIHDALRNEYFAALRIGADESIGHYDYNLHGCMIKKRTETGIDIVLSKKMKSIIQHSNVKSLLIFDDLCDGGASFIAISGCLKSDFKLDNIYLFVVHGLFTKGIDNVANHFDSIITTNSSQDFDDHPKLQVIDVWGN
jgi:hypothetical protein